MGYKILCIDGGGIRGIYSLQILKMLEEEVDSDIFKKVDCFAGTSAGALIVAALSQGYTAKDLMRFFSFFGRRVFQKNPQAKDGGAKYTNRFLSKALKRMFPKNPTLADINKHIIIPACSLCSEEDGKWLPKIYDNLDRNAAKEYHLIDAALKSAAAPIYFSSHRGYVDGGLFALNPSLIAYSRALEKKHGDIQLLSIGNGINPAGINEEVDWNEVQWMVPYREVARHPLFALLTDIGSCIPDYPLRQILGGSYHRVNGPLDEPVEIDDANKAGLLIRNAKSIPCWEETKTWIREKFLQ